MSDSVLPIVNLVLAALALLLAGVVGWWGSGWYWQWKDSIDNERLLDFLEQEHIRAGKPKAPMMPAKREASAAAQIDPRAESTGAGDET
jgi:hypothetical protein